MEHAPGFSGVGGGGALEPWATSDFLGKSWEILELAAKFWESPAENSGIFASSDGIVHGCTNHECTNHDPRRGEISIT